MNAPFSSQYQYQLLTAQQKYFFSFFFQGRTSYLTGHFTILEHRKINFMLLRNYDRRIRRLQEYKMFGRVFVINITK